MHIDDPGATELSKLEDFFLTLVRKINRDLTCSLPVLDIRSLSCLGEKFDTPILSTLFLGRSIMDFQVCMYSVNRSKLKKPPQIYLNIV